MKLSRYLLVLIIANIILLFLFHDPQKILNYLIHFNMDSELLNLLAYLGNSPVSGIIVY